MSAIIPVASFSAAQDLGFLALRDIDIITRAGGLGHRIVGGQAVSLLFAATGKTDPRPRDTADADVAAEFEVLGDQALIDGLRNHGYQAVNGSRFARPLSGTELVASPDIASANPTVDFMGPSSTGVHVPNRQAGALTVDAFPGVGLPLDSEGIKVTFDVLLTTGEHHQVNLHLPAPDHLLVIKLLAWNSRFRDKDVIDIYRLLTLCDQTGTKPQDWRPRAARGDALKALKKLASTGSVGLRTSGLSSREQLTLRALAGPAVALLDPPYLAGS